MLGRTAGFDYLHVPHQGRGAVQDLIKGEIASAVMPVDSLLWARSQSRTDPRVGNDRPALALGALPTCRR